jgi:O-antigen/teichoic acid export membrane protein
MKISRELIASGSFGLVDQSLISGTNFVVFLVAARALGPSGFGVFSLLLTAMGIFAIFQSSLITLPHNVLGAIRKGVDYRRYTGTALTLQLALAILTCVAYLLASGVSVRLYSELVVVLVAMAFSAAAFQLQGFIRGVLYTEFRIAAAMVNDMLTYGLRLVLVGVIVLTVGVTVENLIIVMGVTWLVGAAVGFWQIRQSIQLCLELEVVGQHWQFGRWLVANSLVGNARTFVTAALMTLLLSPGAYGAYRAFAKVVRATNVPMNTLKNVLRPRLAKEAESGPQAMWRTMRPIIYWGTGISAIFAGAIAVFREPIIGLIYGSEYVPYAAAIFLVALRPIMKVYEEVLTVALQARRLTRPILASSAVGAISGSTIGGIALFLFGLPASGAIALTGEAFRIAWLSRSCRRVTSDARDIAANQVSATLDPATAHREHSFDTGYDGVRAIGTDTTRSA